MALRVLKLCEHVVVEHAAIIREVIPVRIAAIDLTVRRDDKRLKTRVVRSGSGIVEKPALNRVTDDRRPSNLDLAAFVRIEPRQPDANKRGEIKITGTPVIGHTIQGG